MRGSDFIFDSVQLMYYKRHKVYFKHGGSYKNKITRSSIIEYLLLKVKINYTQYFANNPIGIIML